MSASCTPRRGRVLAPVAVAMACLVAWWVAWPLGAQRERLSLGEGLAVAPCALAPSPFEPPQCWEPVGFTFGSYGVLRRARTFVRAPVGGPLRGRIFAALPDNPSQLGAARMAPVVYSDDLGVRWQEALWGPSVGAVTLGAFAPLALAVWEQKVVAAGEYARLWVSHDGGAHFVERRQGGQTYTGLEVLGRAIVLSDVDGRVLLSTDDGLSLRTLVSEGGTREARATVRREADAIVVVAGRRTLRIDARGQVR